MAGGAIAGLGGASLTLFYPGSWNEGISSGQGLIAVALVIFARWSPWRCVGAALLFGGFGAAGSLLQRRLGLPDASVLVLQGFAFVLILAAEGLRGRLFQLELPRAARLRLVRAGVKGAA